MIRAALTTVKFPGFSRDIVSFGLVKKIDIDAENNVTIDLVIESKNADIPRYIFEGVHGVMKHLPGVKHCNTQSTWRLARQAFTRASIFKGSFLSMA